MIDTGFHVPEAKPTASPIQPRGASRIVGCDEAASSVLGWWRLVSTVADYLRFCQMMLNGGELDGARILTPETVRLMVTNSLPADIRFAHDIIWSGNRSKLRARVRSPHQSRNKPRAGISRQLHWGGVWGTYFWIDPAEKLIAVLMIQVAPSASGAYQSAFRNLNLRCVRIPEEPVSAASMRPVAVSTENARRLVGKYYFGPATSSRDRQAPPIGLGVQIAAEHGEIHVTKTFDGGFRIQSRRAHGRPHH